MDGTSLERYMSNGVEEIVKGMIKASARYPRAGLFMTKHVMDSMRARKIRQGEEKKGEHIPPFLIASITNHCNLHCTGCYARANKSCIDHANDARLMTESQWDDIFFQAQQLGIEFILLAGGEPLIRKDILWTAAKHTKIIFPVFTNGTMIDGDYISFFDKNRNILPVLSLEGNEKTTDKRRGVGVYQRLDKAMNGLKKHGILFGASVTVTKNNIEEVFSDTFTDNLFVNGIRAVIYVEYVPVDIHEREIAPDDSDREFMNKRLDILRKEKTEILFISFPGDEKSSGGCLAAGRGFFHINAHGGAEPCPFSPYSDTSILTTTLRQALHSPLFQKLRSGGNMEENHIGGCVLFEQREEVEKLSGQVSSKEEKS